MLVPSCVCAYVIHLIFPLTKKAFKLGSTVRPWKEANSQKERIVFQASFFRGELLNFGSALLIQIILSILVPNLWRMASKKTTQKQNKNIKEKHQLAEKFTSSPPFYLLKGAAKRTKTIHKTVGAEMTPGMLTSFPSQPIPGSNQSSQYLGLGGWADYTEQSMGGVLWSILLIENSRIWRESDGKFRGKWDHHWNVW